MKRSWVRRSGNSRHSNIKNKEYCWVHNMPELQSNIKTVNEKLQRLLRNHAQLQKDNERQSKLIKELLEEKTRNSEQIALLQQQLDILKTSAGQMNGADKKAFEKNISQYIKEIDKCIGLLSD